MPPFVVVSRGGRLRVHRGDRPPHVYKVSKPMCANSVESVVDLQPAQDYDGPFIGAATFVKIVQLSLVTARHHVVVLCKNANRGTELCHLIADTFESQVHAVTANRVVWRDGGSITMYSRHHKHVYREGTEWRVIRQRGPTFVVWG